MICSCLALNSPEAAAMGTAPESMGEWGPGSYEAGEADWSLQTLEKVTEGLVHDFNNLLAAIAGFAELILAGAPEDSPGDAGAGSGPVFPPPPPWERITEFARDILEATAAGQGVVHDLRTLTCRGKRERESLDLHDVLGQSLALARASLGSRISTSCEFSPGPIRLLGYRGLLLNAFLNLFLNARDALPEGGDIHIRTAVFPDPGEPEGGEPTRVMVAIRDNGVGMPKEVLERVFERGFTTKGTKGNGQGLANVMCAVALHRGWIEVGSEPGVGTEFRFHLPLLLPGDSAESTATEP